MELRSPNCSSQSVAWHFGIALCLHLTPLFISCLFELCHLFFRPFFIAFSEARCAAKHAPAMFVSWFSRFKTPWFFSLCWTPHFGRGPRPKPLFRLLLDSISSHFTPSWDNLSRLCFCSMSWTAECSATFLGWRDSRSDYNYVQFMLSVC